MSFITSASVPANMKVNNPTDATINKTVGASSYNGNSRATR